MCITDNCSSDMCSVTVRKPSTAKYRQSEAVSRRERRLISRRAKGSSTIEPMSTRSAVSCMGAKKPPRPLSATSVVEYSAAASPISRYPFFRCVNPLHLSCPTSSCGYYT